MPSPSASHSRKRSMTRAPDADSAPRSWHGEGRWVRVKSGGRGVGLVGGGSVGRWCLLSNALVRVLIEVEAPQHRRARLLT